MKAVIMPPSITMNICTVTATVIILLSVVLNFILFSECVTKGSVGVIPCSKPSNSQWILSTVISYLELFVVEMGPGPVFKLKVNPQFHWPVFVKQLNTKLQFVAIIKVSKPFFILLPFLSKCYDSIFFISLYNHPSSISSVHVTIYTHSFCNKDNT